MSGTVPRRLVCAGVSLIIVIAASLGGDLLTNQPAHADAAALGTDTCVDQCADILPPGENGNATVADILANRALGTRPAHASDQLGMYANLVSSYTGLTDDQITNFFNDSSFGVPAGAVERSYSPRSDVRIVRDKAAGIPHITGTTRAGTMFGAGYAGAEDRLFLMDVFRHVGRGELTSFAGGAQGNRDLEQSFWRNAPYTEADLTDQINRLRAAGPRGQQLYDDAQSYLAGVNAYITTCMANRNCPGEYVLTGHLDAITNAGGPQPFTATDLVAIGGVIGALFGGGGGTEMQSALVRIAARAKYGTAEGDRVWQAFRAQNDPEATLTLHNGQSFPYGQASPTAPSVALPDPGSASFEPVVYGATGSAATPATTGSAATAPAIAAGTANTAAAAGVLPGLQAGAGLGMSNAVVISGDHTSSGNPVAVFGPQTGYFAPQLLMLEELQGPGISARGIAFSGLNQYVEIGRGPDYAWSATSSLQDISDTYAVALCDPTGATPTINADHYLYHGTCLPMEKLVRSNAWQPTVADATAAGSYQLVMWRTKYGLLTWRGMVAGQPTAFAVLRSTYRHELDSAIGFSMINDPAQMGDAAGFQQAAANIGYSFNWFYVNADESAMFTSGQEPQRPSTADPNLPMRADPAYEWVNWNPDLNTATYVPPEQHPQAVNQDYFVSWNNKQAKDFSAADGNFSFGPVQRADLLDRQVRAAVTAGTKLGRSDVVKIVERAAQTDLRGAEVLPDLLKVIKSQPVTDPTLAAAVAQLDAWGGAGALRRETALGSKQYADADAIRIMDAWWPSLVRAEFHDALGDGLYKSLVDALEINESPSGGQRGDVSPLPGETSSSQAHKGSSFQYGWWGYVDKDLRAVLGEPVSGWTDQRFCGASAGGSLDACRQALLDTLRTAVAQPATAVYPADATCAAGDQWCADSIVQSALGGITHPAITWQNRPTFQQVVSFPARRGDNVANLALGRPVTVTSTQILFSKAAAVDGDRSTRWSSGSSDNQAITVDLGASQPVSRVILRWEAAYAAAYRIDVSTDGTTWRTVAATSAGDGGLDTVGFAPTQARYVRMAGVKRATSYGYSLWEFEVYAH